MVSERSALVSFPDPASKDKIKQQKQPSESKPVKLMTVEDGRGCVCVLHSRDSNPVVLPQGYSFSFNNLF